MKTSARLLMVASLLAQLFLPASAIAAPTPSEGDALHVYVITMGPGADPWEKFGHDCIRIVDERDGSDLSYNWGVFSFGQGVSGFVSFGVQFLRGRLNYSMQHDDTEYMVSYYVHSGRS